MKPRTVITAVVLVLCFALMFLNFGNQVSGYATFEEAGYERSHVVGTWAKKDLTTYDRYDNTFTFYLKDESGGVEKVAYHGTMPVNFAEADKIVVEGRMGKETFRAESILVKCPSKYNNQPA